ncbi:hypothetical protein ACOTH4_28345 [Achromobacter xylosoxidans]
MADHVNYDIEVRMRLLINEVLHEKKDWKGLEQLTGVKSVKWRHFHSEVTKASLEMLEALFRTYPEYAFWLATGISDEDAGHLAPLKHEFPGRPIEDHPTFARQAATSAYFRDCQQAADLTWKFEAETLKDADGNSSGWKQSIASHFGLGATFQSAWLAEQMGQQEHQNLLERIFRSQRAHLEETIKRLRSNNPEADGIIDRQRKQAEEKRAYLDEMLKKPDGN